MFVFTNFSDNDTFHVLSTDGSWLFKLKGNRVDHLLSCSGLNGSKDNSDVAGSISAVAGSISAIPGSISAVPGSISAVVGSVMVKHDSIVG